MEFLTLIIRAPGYIFGPLTLLAGLVALGMCIRAALRSNRLASRQALVVSLLPIGMGLAGAFFGASVWALSGKVAPDRAFAWTLIGCTILFGVFVSVVPVLWSLLLLNRRPAAIA